MRSENFLEPRKGEVHGIVKVCIAPPRSARAPDEGMPISSGIRFLMYKFGRLVA
jgi:hypothetical protein